MTSTEIQQLMDDFVAEFGRMASARAFSLAGIWELKKKMAPLRTGSPDQLISLGPEDPTLDTSTVHGQWTVGELDEATTPGSWLSLWFSDAWIALIYARWELFYRPEFARVSGAEKEAITCDVMGDLRHLRNDVAHHAGIATAKETGKCTVMTRFQVGQRIALTPEDIKFLNQQLAVRVSAPR